MKFSIFRLFSKKTRFFLEKKSMSKKNWRSWEKIASRIRLALCLEIALRKIQPSATIFSSWSKSVELTIFRRGWCRLYRYMIVHVPVLVPVAARKQGKRGGRPQPKQKTTTRFQGHSAGARGTSLRPALPVRRGRPKRRVLKGRSLAGNKWW